MSFWLYIWSSSFCQSPGGYGTGSHWRTLALTGGRLRYFDWSNQQLQVHPQRLGYHSDTYTHWPATSQLSTKWELPSVCASSWLIPGLICDSPVSRLTVRHELTCRLATCRMPRVSFEPPTFGMEGGRLNAHGYSDAAPTPLDFCTQMY